MDALRTPEDLLARINENKLICEKLLGWHKCSPNSKGARRGFDWEESEDTPDFSSWGQAGLIMDAFILGGIGFEVVSGKNGCHCQLFYKSRSNRHDNNIPLAIRAAALEYIRSLP